MKIDKINIVLSILILLSIVGLFVYILKNKDVESNPRLGLDGDCLPDGSIGMYCDFDIASTDKKCIMNPAGNKCCGDSHTQSKGLNEVEWICGAKN